MNKETALLALPVLREARALISDPSRWTKGAEARDIGGKSISSRSDSAVCFCSSGAVEHIVWRDRASCPVSTNKALFAGLIALCEEVERDTGYRKPIEVWNDNEARTHEEVLTLFDLAIERLEEEVAA